MHPSALLFLVHGEVHAAQESEMLPRVILRKLPRAESRLARCHEAVEPADVQFHRILDLHGAIGTGRNL